MWNVRPSFLLFRTWRRGGQVACLSPADMHFEDNLSTLHYAVRTQALRNAPTVNMDPKSALIMRLREEATPETRETETSRGRSYWGSHWKGSHSWPSVG